MKRNLPILDTRLDVVDGYRMFSRICTSAGQGRLPVVLVHGLSMSSRYLLPTARRLALDYAVYVPDLPGYGESQKPPKTLSLPELASVLGHWMDSQGIGPALLLGNSMGCQTIVELAVTNPGRVRSAVLIGPTMDPRSIGPLKLFFRAVMNMLFEPARFYLVLAHDYFAAGMRETFQGLNEAENDPMEAKLRQMDFPTLVVRGEHDWLVTQPWVEHLTHLLPQGQMAVIPGGAHVVNYDSAGRLVPLVEAFWKEV